MFGFDGGRRFSCSLCLTDNSVRMRLDKRGRPYLVCGACGSRTFMPSAEALRGLVLLQPAVREFIQAIKAAQLQQAQSTGLGFVRELAQAQAQAA